MSVETFLLSNESTIRSALFFGALTSVALWELLAPRRRLLGPVAPRWFGNAAMGALNTLTLRLVFPVLTFGMAVLASERQWGLFNNVSSPVWLSAGLTMLVLDGAFYAQHRMFHEIPLLWRLHRVHHADRDYDFTTGLRFHFLEGLLFNGVNVMVVAVLGPPVGVVIVFEALVGAQASLEHGNVRLPEGIDRILRFFLVTPDMHRVHHSVQPSETNSNFSNVLPMWDRLCGTYCAQPAAGHDGMEIGLRQFRDPKFQTLPWMLALPFLPVGRGYRRPLRATGDGRDGEGPAGRGGQPSRPALGGDATGVAERLVARQPLLPLGPGQVRD